MSKAPLTEKQLKVYRFLVSRLNSGLPPTVREICAETGIRSTSTVHAILNGLEEESYIIRDAKFSRAIRLGTDFDSAMVPLVGKITAGKPILAIEEIEDYIPLKGFRRTIRSARIGTQHAGRGNTRRGYYNRGQKRLLPQRRHSHRHGRRRCHRKAPSDKRRADYLYARKSGLFTDLPRRAARYRQGYRMLQKVLTDEKAY